MPTARVGRPLTTTQYHELGGLVVGWSSSGKAVYQALRRGSVNAERLIVTNASVSSRAIKGVRMGYVASLLQKGGDVVAVKDGAGTMATDRHCHALADTGTDHVSCC